jgi:hypothetical protein
MNCQIVPWVLVIIGWFFVDERNNRRELRKEKRALIDKINVDLNSIEKIAVEYHQNDHANVKTSQEIKISLDRVVKILKREKLLTQKDYKKFIEFRQAITLNNFDSSGFVTQLDNSELLQNIYLTKDDLLHVMEIKFNDDFRGNQSRLKFW